MRALRVGARSNHHRPYKERLSQLQKPDRVAIFATPPSATTCTGPREIRWWYLISGPVNDPDNQKRGRKRGGELVVRTKVLQSLCLEELFYASTLPESTSDVQVCNNDPVVQFSYTIHNTEERERPGRRDTSVDRHSSLIYEFSNQQGYSTTNKISKKNQLSVFRVQTAVQTQFRFRELKVDT